MISTSGSVSVTVHICTFIFSVFQTCFTFKTVVSDAEISHITSANKYVLIYLIITLFQDSNIPIELWRNIAVCSSVSDMQKENMTRDAVNIIGYGLLGKDY